MNPEHLIEGKKYRFIGTGQILKYKRAEQLINGRYLYYFTSHNFKGDKIIRKLTTSEVTRKIEYLNKIHLAMEEMRESE